MRKIVAGEKQKCYVSEVNELAGHPSVYVDSQFGWTVVPEGLCALKTEEGWEVAFPDPVDLA